MDPFGWRIAAAVVGSLMVLVMCRLARRVTGSTAARPRRRAPAALDGLQLVLSRLALLDIFVAFFILLGVHCIVADRQLVPGAPGATGADPRAVPARGCSPPASPSGWRSAPSGRRSSRSPPSACCCRRGTPAPAARSASAGPAEGTAHRRPGRLRHLVLVALVVYVASWTGWLIHASDYEERPRNTQYTTYAAARQWATASEPDARGPRRGRRSRCARCGTTTTTSTRSTPTSSTTARTSTRRNPVGWLLLNRPVGVDAQLDIQPGSQGCDAPAGSTCLRQVLLLGNPVIWWAGTLALLFARGPLGRRPRLALRGRGGRRRRRPGCRGCCTTTGRSSSSTRSPPCRSSCSALTLALGSIVGSLERADPAAYRRRRDRRVVRRAGGARLRVVLADLDRPADHARGVAATDLVHALDLEMPNGPSSDGPFVLVEVRGLEPLAFSMRTRRATSCATPPSDWKR